MLSLAAGARSLTPASLLIDVLLVDVSLKQRKDLMTGQYGATRHGNTPMLHHGHDPPTTRLLHTYLAIYFTEIS